MKTTSILIESPCPMAMFRLKNKNGSFYCNSCRNAVVDFTTCTNDEIKEKYQPGMCGIFRDDQIETPRFSSFYKMRLALLTLISVFGFNVKPMNAQSRIGVEKRITEMREKSNSVSENKNVCDMPSQKTKVTPRRKSRHHYRKGKYRYVSIGCPSF